MERLSSVDMQCVKAARFYHAGINLLQPIFTSITPALSFNARSIHYDAHHIVGNKGVRSGSA